MPRQVIIIGGVAAGMSAATRLRRLDEFATIIVLERGPFPSFANCGLPYHLGGEIKDRAKLIVQSPARLREVFQLDVRANTEAVHIDRDRREVSIRNRVTGEVSTLTYTELVLAMGAKAILPSVPGAERAGLFPLRTIPEMDGILAWIAQHQAKTAVVVGGGYIGLEAAEQLVHRGLKVTVVQRGSQVLNQSFDAEMVAPVHAELRKHKIDLKLNVEVTEFAEQSSEAAASVVHLSTGEQLAADVVILSIGVKPETSLATAAGIKLGRTGGIAANNFLQTNDPNIYAAGDVVEVVDRVNGDARLLPLAGPANRMGRMVADNIVSPGSSSYNGSLGTAIVRVFGLTAARTGLTEQQLRTSNVSFRAVHLHPNSHAGYYPGAKSIALKLLYSPDTKLILGAQAVGEDGVDKRIDVIATAMLGKLTIEQLAQVELCYAPPYGSAKDPVNLAGMVAENDAAGLVEATQWHELPNLLEAGAMLIDVRDTKEYETGAIPHSVHIELKSLRERLADLPKDKLIIVHCASGQRSYNACRILTQHGYTVKNLSGSYKTWKQAHDG